MRGSKDGPGRQPSGRSNPCRRWTMATSGNPRSTGFNPWLLVLVAAAVILVAVLFFMSGPVDEPRPTPDLAPGTSTDTTRG